MDPFAINILYDKKVRSKRKKWWYIFAWSWTYTQSEKISLKEKLYTYWYNLEKNGHSTVGEHDWYVRMEKMNTEQFMHEMEYQFKVDYRWYISHPTPKK